MNFWQFADAHPVLVTAWIFVGMLASAAFGPLVVITRGAKKAPGKDL